jgi:ascorbate-specific PTS system EIIC-type component UlaA
MLHVIALLVQGFIYGAIGGLIGVLLMIGVTKLFSKP